MILNRQNLSENNWNHFKIVPQGHNNCQLSIVNCQFGEAAKFQSIVLFDKPDMLTFYSKQFRPVLSIEGIVCKKLFLQLPVPAPFFHRQNYSPPPKKAIVSRPNLCYNACYESPDCLPPEAADRQKKRFYMVWRYDHAVFRH